MPKIIVINMIDNNSSFTMAVRLKQLREEKGLSHDKLSKALFSHYGVKVSSDSLCNYEVASKDHSKAYKNQGMRVEYLRCLADFYGVSCDYLLGADVPRSPDTTVHEIIKFTGLSEDNVISLYTWAHLSDFSEDDSGNTHNTSAKVLRKARRHYKPNQLADQVIDLSNRLLIELLNHPEPLCRHFSSFLHANLIYTKFNCDHPMPDGYWPTKEVQEEIQEHGIALINAYDAIKWHLSQFCDALKLNLMKAAKLEAEERINDGNC